MRQMLNLRNRATTNDPHPDTVHEYALSSEFQGGTAVLKGMGFRTISAADRIQTAALIYQISPIHLEGFEPPTY